MKYKKFYKEFICLFLVFIIAFCVGIFNIQSNIVSAEDNTISVSSDNAITIEDKCREMTKTKISKDDIDRKHFENYIPRELFLQAGSYGYIGEEYGFLIIVEKREANLVFPYEIQVLLIDVEYNNDVEKSTINYKLKPIEKYSALFNKLPQTGNIELGVRIIDGLFMGDIFLLTEFNTIHELSLKDKNYRMVNDNSIYADCVATDYVLHEKNENYETELLANFNTALMDELIGNIVEEILGELAGPFALPLSLLKSVFEVSPDKVVMNKGLEYNALSYSEQVKNKRLETKFAINMGHNKYLGANDELTFQIKYDNKLHTNEEFQTGFKLGFNIYEGISKRQMNEKDKMIESYCVYNNYESASSFHLEADEVYFGNNKIVENACTNKFINNGEPLKLTFTAFENKEYLINTSKNTFANLQSLSVIKGEKYEIDYNLNGQSFGELKFDDRRFIELGQCDLHSPLGEYIINCTNTDAYVYTIDSEKTIKNLYITDADGVILNKVSNKNTISYVFQKNERYKLFVESDYNQTITLRESVSNQAKQNIFLGEGEYFYISFVSPFRNYAFIKDNNLSCHIYDINGNIVNRFLEKNNKYFFEIYGGNNMNYNVEITFNTILGRLNQNIDLLTNMNQIVEFDCQEDLVYDFGDYFDVYYEDTAVYNVNKLFMNRGKKYYIVNSYNEDKLCIKYKINQLNFNNSIMAEAYEIYQINVAEYGVYTTENANKLFMYDSERSKIDYNNGFMLPAGTYYFLSKEKISVNLQETRHAVYVKLIDEDKIIETIRLDYGYPFNISPLVKSGYIFNGWKCDTQLLTDEKGASKGVFLYYNDISVIADYSVKDLYLSIDNDGEIKWLTNEGEITNNQGEARIITMATLRKVVDGLLKKVYGNEIKKEGHYKVITEEGCEETDSSYILPLKIHWHKEKYTLTFDTINNYSIETEYGESLTDLTTLINAQNNELYDFISWRYETFNFVFQTGMPFVVPDLTADFENSNKQGVHFEIIRERVEASVKVNINIYNNSNILQRSLSVNVSCYLGLDYDLVDLLSPQFAIFHYNINYLNGEQVSTDLDSLIINVAHKNNPIININATGKDYRIIISKGSLYGDYRNTFVTHYNVTSPTFTLPSVYTSTSTAYIHTGWEVLGKEYGIHGIVNINEQDFGVVEIVPIFTYNEILIKNGQRHIYTNNDKNHYGAIAYDLTGATNDVIIQVNGYVKYVKFISDGHQISNIYVGFDNAQVTSNVKMVSCNFLGRKVKGTPVLSGGYDNLGYVFNASHSTIDTLSVDGKNIIRQADFAYNDNNIARGAMMTEALTVSGNGTLHIYAGNGAGYVEIRDKNKNLIRKDGVDAGTAWYSSIAGGPNAETVINTDVYVYGGKATDGINGADGGAGVNGKHGGNGGSMGYSFMTSGILKLGYSSALHHEKGVAGNGGKGGNGGDGVNAEWFGPSSTAGGNGGDGGDGGKVVYDLSFRSCPTVNFIIGGNSSRGGAGGTKGLGGKPLVGENRPNGIAGTPGKGYSVEVKYVPKQ